MPRSDVVVYMVLCAHIGADWGCYLSIHRMEELTGLHRATIHRSLARLTASDRIRIAPGGGRGRANRYTILHAQNGRTAMRPFDIQNRRILEPKRSHSYATPTDRTEKIQQQQNTEIQGGRAAAAAVFFPPSKSPPEASLESELALVGVRQPARRRLATLKGLTAELIRSTARQVLANGGRGGVLVAAIEDAVRVKEIIGSGLGRKPTAVDLGREIDLWLASLTVEELERLREAALADCSPRYRKYVDQFKTADFMPLKVMMWERRDGKRSGINES